MGRLPRKHRMRLASRLASIEPGEYPALSFFHTFYLQIIKKIVEPTSGLEPLT
jgi:hypothetical protein